MMRNNEIVPLDSPSTRSQPVVLQPLNVPALADICRPDPLVRAWRKVKSNGGGPGVDGETLADFERDVRANLEHLRRELLAGDYQPRMVRRVWVPKASGSLRPLAILAIRDRVAQRLVHDALAPAFERKFLDCSFGFREGRSVDHAVAIIDRWRDTGRRWVADGDIKDCFEQFDHELLLAMLSRDVRDPAMLDLIRRWLKARIFNEMSSLAGGQRTAGAFQGGVMSPLLCNVYLHPFDQVMTQLGLALVRYADDWVILCDRKVEAEAALNVATEVLARLRLSINPYRTRVTHFDQGFAFLGTFFVRNERFALSPGARQVSK